MKDLIVCQYCQMQFKSIPESIQHIKKKHGDKKFRCTQCSRHYTHKNNLTRHIASDHPVPEEAKDEPRIVDRGGRRLGQTLASGTLKMFEDIELKVRPKEGEQLPTTRMFNFIKDKHLFNSPKAQGEMKHKPWEVYDMDVAGKRRKALNESKITTYSFDSEFNQTNSDRAYGAKWMYDIALQEAVADYTIDPNAVVKNINRDFLKPSPNQSKQADSEQTPDHIRDQLEAYEACSSAFHSSQANDIPADLLPRNPAVTSNLFGAATGNMVEKRLTPAFIGSNQSATFPYQAIGQGNQLNANFQVSPALLLAEKDAVLSFGSAALSFGSVSDSIQTPPAYVPVERGSGKKFNPKQPKTVAMFKRQLNMDLGRRRMQ